MLSLTKDGEGKFKNKQRIKNKETKKTPTKKRTKKGRQEKIC